MPQNKSTKFMDTVIFTLYNYASNQREEYLLLKLFKTALEEEIKYVWNSRESTQTLISGGFAQAGEEIAWNGICAGIQVEVGWVLWDWNRILIAGWTAGLSELLAVDFSSQRSSWISFLLSMAATAEDRKLLGNFLILSDSIFSEGVKVMITAKVFLSR